MERLKGKRILVTDDGICGEPLEDPIWLIVASVEMFQYYLVSVPG